MSSCEQIQELMSRMLDEDLTPQELALVEKHRASCPDCAAMYAAFHALSVELGEDLAEAPERLRENVMAELRRDEIRKKNNRRPWRGVLVAAACVVLFVGITQFVNPRLGTKAISAKSTAQSMITAEYAALPPMNGAGMSEEAEEAASDAPETIAQAAADMAVENGMFSASRALADTAEDAGAFYDLSDQMALDELLAFLGGSAVDTIPDNAEAPAYTLLLSDGTLDLYLSDGQLYYYRPADGQPVLSGQRVDALLPFLQK